MNLTTILFSPTGGTRKVAELIANSIGTIDKEIDLTRRDCSQLTLSAEDVAVIAVPSYSGRVPALALQRIKLVNGNGASAVLVVVSGNHAY